jgi:ketosteroid isomerase-like protein
MTTEAEQLRIERDAANLVHRFFRHLDDCAYDKLAALMARDGVWHRQGKALAGPAMVQEAMKGRPAALMTRHLVSNLLVDAVDADHAEASCYVTVYAHTGEHKPDEPAPLEQPLQIMTYRIRLTRTADGARIDEIAGKVAFRK